MLLRTGECCLTDHARDPQAWVAKADEDAAAAEGLLRADGSLFGVASYHGQQAAEKSLKAVLVCAGQEPPRTHDLAQLLALVQDCCGVEVEGLVSDAGWLTACALDTRYPDVPGPGCTRERADRALAIATRRRDFCRDGLAACSG